MWRCIIIGFVFVALAAHRAGAAFGWYALADVSQWQVAAVYLLLALWFFDDALRAYRDRLQDRLKDRDRT